jgi:WD40 repeat protein
MLVAENDRLGLAMPDQTVAALTLDGRLAAVAGGLTYRGGVLGFGGGVRANPIRIIETASGRDVVTFRLQGEIPMPTDLRFSPDGRLLAAKFLENRTDAAGDTVLPGSLIVYEVGTGREVKRFPSGDGSHTGGIGFSPDSKILASRINLIEGPEPADLNSLNRSISGAIKLFEVGTWKEVRELTNTGADLSASGLRGVAASPLTFSGDGKLLAASLGDGIALFETSSGSRVRVLRTTERAAAISAGPSVDSSRDAMMRQTGVDPDQIRALMESVGGIAADLPDVVRSRVGIGSNITFTPDGRLLSVVGAASVWDTVAGVPRPRSEAADRMLSSITGDGSVAFSADGRFSAQAGFEGAYGDAATSAVIIKEVATGRTVQTIPIGKASIPSGTFADTPQADSPLQISGLAFNARGLLVQYCDFELTGGRRSMLGGGLGFKQECHVKTFDPVSGKQLRDLKLEGDNSSTMGFFGAGSGVPPMLSPNGRFLVTFKGETPNFGGGGLRSRFGLGGFGIPGGSAGSDPGQPYTMTGTDIENGRKVWEVKGESASLMSTPSVTFSARDAVLAITSVEKSRPVIKLYDTTSGRALTTLDVGNRNAGAMVFSRDSKRLAITYNGGNRAFGVEGGRSPGRGATSAAGENLTAVYDVSNGRQLFAMAHQTPVNSAAFSPNGRLIVTVGQDRNQRIWDAQTGEQLATLVNLDVLANVTGTVDWLVVTPDGLFDGSPSAWQQIMWRFSPNTFDVGPVEIFFNELYYPGLAGEIFSGRRPKAPRDLQQIDRRQPNVTLSHAATGEIATRLLTVRIDVAEAPADAARGQGSGARDVRLFRNGTLVKLWPGDVLGGQSRTSLETTLPIVAGENRLTAYAFNRENVKSADASLTVTGAASLNRQGTAYVLALGVNQYDNAQYNLKYAVADATTFADEIRAQQGKVGRFDRVEVVELLDKDATKANVLLALRRLAANVALPPGAPAAFAKLSQAEPEDAVIIYFAGHGTAQGARFYLVPHDLGYSGPRAGIDAQAVETILSHSVSDLELESAVEGLQAGQLVLVIDACNSGQALEAEEKRRGPMNSKGLAQLAYEKGMYILTAAQSYQAALETSQLGHGYLTFTLVEEGLKKGMADLGQKDGQVLVREWFDYAIERVPEMQQNNNDTRLLLAQDDKMADQNAVGHLQIPRAFYRREVEAIPVIIGKP